MTTDNKFLIDLWRETRNCINHLDKMMDGVRVRTYTLFGTITSVAAALYFWAPNVYISSIRLSAFVELVVIIILIPSIIQNRLYHFWLFKAINTSLYLENLIFSNLDKKGPKMQIMLTHSLTELEERAGSYWSAMKHSKLFWVEMAIFIFMIIASIVLFIAFWFSGPN